MRVLLYWMVAAFFVRYYDGENMVEIDIFSDYRREETSICIAEGSLTKEVYYLQQKTSVEWENETC